MLEPLTPRTFPITIAAYVTHVTEPVELPPGWRSVDPGGLGVPTLHVVVEAG